MRWGLACWWLQPTPANSGLPCKIEIDNWLARWFVLSLEVKYELATKRLLSYKGVSNLLSNNKDMQNVVITYHYDDRS